MAGTGVDGGEGVVWLCEVMAVRAGDKSLICYIGDVDSVQDVRLHPSHIQGVGRVPGEDNGVSANLNTNITHWIQKTWKAVGGSAQYAYWQHVTLATALLYLEPLELHSHSPPSIHLALQPHT